MPTATASRSLADYLRHPWARETITTQRDVIARIPELPGCFATGRTSAEALANLRTALESWLTAAIALGETIPEPGVPAPTTATSWMQIDLPDVARRRLEQRAAVAGTSPGSIASKLLIEALTDVSCVAELSSDPDESIVADALAESLESVQALKSVATVFRNSGRPNLACLLYALAGRLILYSGREKREAARELGMAAALARRCDRLVIAERLWRESLRYEPSNVRNRSSLGLLLYSQGRHRQAIEVLEPASRHDDYALLFLSWARISDSVATYGSPSEDAVATLEAALKRWAREAPVEDRSAWLRHVKKLMHTHASLAPVVNKLVQFANSHAGWRSIRDAELRALCPE